jgi:hypothetical protein
VDNVVLGQFLSEYFGFTLPVLFHEGSIVIHSSITNIKQSYHLRALLNNTLIVSSHTEILVSRARFSQTKFCTYFHDPTRATGHAHVFLIDTIPTREQN